VTPSILQLAHRRVKLRYLLDQIRQSRDMAVGTRLDELVALRP
jgi:hypothetical protein